MNPLAGLSELKCDETLKACCAAVYESDWARLLLGDSFHPGGLALTERLGDLLTLRPKQRVLDVAAGKGSSALFMARHFGCQVVGIDYGEELVAAANQQAVEAGMAHQVRFEHGDAEQLPFAAGQFDAIICECAFCTFPDKSRAAREFGRVLRSGGQVGLSDITRTGPLPAELEGLLAWIACVADARPLEQYVSFLETAGFNMKRIEPHDAALMEKVIDVRTKLVGAELLMKLQQIELSDVDFGRAKAIAHNALRAVQEGSLGYAIVIGAIG